MTAFSYSNFLTCIKLTPIQHPLLAWIHVAALPSVLSLLYHALPCFTMLYAKIYYFWLQGLTSDTFTLFFDSDLRASIYSWQIFPLLYPWDEKFSIVGCLKIGEKKIKISSSLSLRRWFFLLFVCVYLVLLLMKFLCSKTLTFHLAGFCEVQHQSVKVTWRIAMKKYFFFAPCFQWAGSLSYILTYIEMSLSSPGCIVSSISILGKGFLYHHALGGEGGWHSYM